MQILNGHCPLDHSLLNRNFGLKQKNSIFTYLRYLRYWQLKYVGRRIVDFRTVDGPKTDPRMTHCHQQEFLIGSIFQLMLPYISVDRATKSTVRREGGVKME